MIDALIPRIFRGRQPAVLAERVQEGVSTYVYRLRRGAETFYLRVLPEAGDSFAPEVRVHELLRARGVSVPEVVYFEHCNELVRRSVMVTTAIPGSHVGRLPVGEAARSVLAEAGRQLALINQVPVHGFGWIRRDRPFVTELEAEHATLAAFIHEDLEGDLRILEGRMLSPFQTTTIRGLISTHKAWLESTDGWLAHGDLDVTHVLETGGCYSGIIDFGEIRGADRWYDLGHFRMHDGETLPAPVLEWLLQGYRSAIPLPADHYQRICFASLLIAVRSLARRFQKTGLHAGWHQALVSIPRDLAVLTA